MLQNIYVTILNDGFGSIADIWDVSDPEDAKIIEQARNDKSCTVLSLVESVEYMKQHPSKTYFVQGDDPQEIRDFLKQNRF